jgi:hypothetical protein
MIFHGLFAATTSLFLKKAQALIFFVHFINFVQSISSSHLHIGD